MPIIVRTRSNSSGRQYTTRYQNYAEFQGGLRNLRQDPERDILELSVPLAELCSVKQAMETTGFNLKLTSEGSDLDMLALAESAIAQGVLGAGAGAGVGGALNYFMAAPAPPVDPITAAAIVKGTVAGGAATGGTTAGAVTAAVMNPVVLGCAAIGAVALAGIKVYRAIRDAPKACVFSVTLGNEPDYVRLTNSMLSHLVIASA